MEDPGCRDVYRYEGCPDVSCKPPPCKFPADPPTTIYDAGVKCCQFPQETCRTSFALPNIPQFAVDSKEPIVVEWPPKKVEKCEYVDTGPRPDLLAMIPDQVVPQVVTMHVTAAPQTLTPSGGTIANQTMPHPLCPDSQMHVRIEPKQKKKPQIKMPEPEAPIRGPPCRPWIQCVENTLLNDQVRRPLARCCFKRPLPPLVIPTSQLEYLKLKSTERQRKKEECEERNRERECLRLRARQRQGKWNYTVESLLDRKRQKEREKEEGEREATRQLLQEVTQEKSAQSEAQLARANQLMLYRKGLIRDFHSSLAYSKMMQEIKDTNTKSGENDDSHCPMIVQKCYKKMMYPNDRPEYTQKKKTPKPCSQRLIERLQQVEQRAREQEKELNAELCDMKREIEENLPDYPESYKKYIAKPVCDDDKKCREQEKLRCEIFKEIGDKLAADAYVESWEDEIDRQACEFNDYKRQCEAIQKAKEKKLIDDKVAYNMAKSEAAAKVLVQMQQSKKDRENEYDALREKWEAEFDEKRREKQTMRDCFQEIVVADFNKRKSNEAWKECELHPARQWARERLVAAENFERDCEEKSQRRKQAEEVVLINKALASAKHCQEEKKRYLNNVWDAKMKQDYLDEMKEMKSYAETCIQDWKAKGRSDIPMKSAMKKWDWDAGMSPRLFGEGDAPINFAVSKQIANSAKKSNCAEFETTSKRLGFGSGGC